MKYSFLVILVLSVFTVFSQKDNLEHHKEVYEQALEYGDLNTAAVAVHNIIASDPKEGNWQDTLARVYFSNQQYGLAKNVAEEILKDEPENTPIRTVAAYSNKSLGMVKEAIPHFEKLYAGTQNLSHLYELVTLQFSMRRYGESAANINKLIEDPKSAEMKTRVQVDKQSYQEVPLKAAALNIKGVISMEMGNLEYAEKFFKQSLEVIPEFALAQQNMQALKKQMAEQQKEKSPTEENQK